MELEKLNGRAFWERNQHQHQQKQKYQVSEWWQLHKQQEGSTSTTGKEKESKESTTH